jgi:hypothetical protein
MDSISCHITICRTHSNCADMTVSSVREQLSICLETRHQVSSGPVSQAARVQGSTAQELFARGPGCAVSGPVVTVPGACAQGSTAEELLARRPGCAMRAS